MTIQTFPSNIMIQDGSAPKDAVPRVLRNSFGDGYSQRIGDGINRLMAGWDLSWHYLSATDKGTLDSFFQSHGGTDVFYWTPPLEATPRKYTCPRWRFTPRAGGYYEGMAELIEEADL